VNGQKEFALNPPGALRASPLGRFCAASDFNAFPLNQCVSDLTPCIMKNPPCGLTGDIKFLIRFFLFQFNEPYLLDLICLQRCFLILLGLRLNFVYPEIQI
jgi:hypothetical protein